MTSTLIQMQRATQRLTQYALYISAAGLVLMTLIISWQVFARYMLNASPSWSESAALLLMLYYILLTAAVGVYESFHLGINILVDKSPPKIARILKVINYSLICVFGLAMLLNGVRLADFTSDHVIPALSISRAFAYWPFAIAGALICIFALEKILFLFVIKEAK